MYLASINGMLEETAERIANFTAMASDLSDLYDVFIRSDEDDVSFIAGWNSTKGRSDGIHASEMSSDCRRPVYYSMKGVQRTDKELDPFWKKRFRVGHTYHAMVQEDWRRLCEKSGGMMRFEREVRIDPSLQKIAQEYNIKSSCDGVISFCDVPHGPAIIRVALEIKTESPAEFEKLKEPKMQHRRQTCVYMKCLDTPLCYTQYVNKGNQNIKPSKHPYLFQFDFDLWGKIEQETKDVTRLVAINEVPPRVEGLGCEFCGFSNTCQPEYLEKKKKREAGKKAREVMQTRVRAGLRGPGSTST